MAGKNLKGYFVSLLMGASLFTWLLMLERGNQVRRVTEPCSTSHQLNTHADERTLPSPNFSGTGEYLDRDQLPRLVEPCSTSPPLPTHAGERTLASLNFSGINEYLDKLFPPCSSTAIPDFPVFLTALSSNHFKEGLILLDHFNQTIRTRYPNVELYFFDIGLSEDQALELILRERPFVVWMDASIRFATSDFDSIRNKAMVKGVLAWRRSNKLLEHTANATFEMLKTDPRLYDGKVIFGAAFIVIRATPYVVQYIMQPWIKCALKFGCMVPVEKADEYRWCKTSSSTIFLCHRFDQSVLSILMHMAYREKEASHEVCQTKNCVFKCSRCKGANALEQLNAMHV